MANETPPDYVVPLETLRATIEYLAGQPFAEVQNIIPALQSSQPLELVLSQLADLEHETAMAHADHERRALEDAPDPPA